MAQFQVAVSDIVFPNLDRARAVLSTIGAELRLAEEPKPEAILRVAKDADALLATYAKITADMIRQMTRCRIISRASSGCMVASASLRVPRSASLVSPGSG